MLAKERINEIHNETAIPIKMLNLANRDEWFHGTTADNAENIKRYGVLANYNYGTMLDFGEGFYLADTFERASGYAARLPVILPDGSISEREEWAVMTFEFNPLSVLFPDNGEAGGRYSYEYFPRHDERFAKFVFQNRVFNVYNEHPHGIDIIWGVMSDSFPDKVIIDYKNKEITYEEAINLLQKPNSMKQLFIGNQEVCDMLSIKEVVPCRKEAV